jgi:hypothetical protein
MGIPDGAVSPLSMDVVAALHAATTRTLAITNRGGHPLDWALWSSPALSAGALAVRGRDDVVAVARIALRELHVRLHTLNHTA